MYATVDYEIVHKNQTEPITFYIRDTLTNDLMDPISGTWSLIKISDDSVVATGTFGATGGSDITRVEEGIYQYSFNASTYSDEYDFALKILQNNEVTTQDIMVKSVSAKHYAYAAALSNQVDKARKSIKDDIENMDRSSDNFNPAIQFFYGYGVKHYIYYLERGVQMLNIIPPYTNLSIDTFPFSAYGSVLIDAATIAALESQGIFAIDTDFNYSLGGNALVIDHFTKLSSEVSAILARFQKNALSWKQLFRTRGLVLYQWGPMAMRTSRLFNVYPSGFYSRLMSTVLQY